MKNNFLELLKNIYPDTYKSKAVNSLKEIDMFASVECDKLADKIYKTTFNIIRKNLLNPKSCNSDINTSINYLIKLGNEGALSNGSLEKDITSFVNSNLSIDDNIHTRSTNMYNSLIDIIQNDSYMQKLPESTSILLKNELKNLNNLDCVVDVYSNNANTTCGEVFVLIDKLVTDIMNGMIRDRDVQKRFTEINININKWASMNTIPSKKDILEESKRFKGNRGSSGKKYSYEDTKEYGDLFFRKIEELEEETFGLVKLKQNREDLKAKMNSLDYSARELQVNFKNGIISESVVRQEIYAIKASKERITKDIELLSSQINIESQLHKGTEKLFDEVKEFRSLFYSTQSKKELFLECFLGIPFNELYNKIADNTESSFNDVAIKVRIAKDSIQARLDVDSKNNVYDMDKLDFEIKSEESIQQKEESIDDLFAEFQTESLELTVNDDLTETTKKVSLPEFDN